MKNRLYVSYTARAKFKGIEFKLTQEEFFSLVFSKCYICGSEPSNNLTRKHWTRGIKYNGIDRIDSSIGYVHGNVQPCCRRCNSMKNDMSIDKFFKHLAKIFYHLRPSVLVNMSQTELSHNDQPEGS